MTLDAPELLAGLLLIPIAILGYLYVQRRRGRYAVRFTNVDLLANLVPSTPAWRRHVPPALYLLAMIALIVGLARPSTMVAVPREEATIVLAMDVSGSMLATDVSPSRLASAKQSASAFIDQLPDTFQVGLVAFSTQAQVRVSPTTDRLALRAALESLEAEGGTALGDAIATSVDVAALAVDSGATSGDGSGSAAPEPGDRPLAATVLLSDGANSTGRLEPLDAANLAATAGVPVYTIALGTADGVVSVPDDNGMLRRIEVPPDTDTLAAIAEATGARSFEAPTAGDLEEIYRGIGSRVGSTQEMQEVTQWFAAAGLVFVLAGAGLAAHWFNRFP